MAKYVIDSGSDHEIEELKTKCRIVRDRISKIGVMLPSIKMGEMIASSIKKAVDEDYILHDDQEEATTSKITRESEDVQTRNVSHRLSGVSLSAKS